MNNTDKNNILYKNVNEMIEQIIDNNTPRTEMFDKLCDMIDTKYEQENKNYGLLAYVRIFWWDDSDADIDNVADELLSLGQQWNIDSYAVVNLTDYDATIVVALHTQK